MAEKKDIKPPVGRPSVITDEVLRKLQYAYLMDCTDEEACYSANIGTTALYEYQKANPEFTEQKKQWKQRPVYLARSTVIKAMEENADMAMKYLERKVKGEFSLRQEIQALGDVTLTVRYGDKKKAKQDGG